MLYSIEFVYTKTSWLGESHYDIYLTKNLLGSFQMIGHLKDVSCTPHDLEHLIFGLGFSELEEGIIGAKTYKAFSLRSLICNKTWAVEAFKVYGVDIVQAVKAVRKLSISRKKGLTVTFNDITKKVNVYG